MKNRPDPPYLLLARRRVAEGRKRVARQQRRVARIKHERRDSTRAASLLETFLRTQARREEQLKRLVRRLKHDPRAKPSPYTRGQFKVRKSAQALREDKAARWDRDVRAFLDRQYPDAPDYKGSLVTLWEKYLSLGLPKTHFVKELTSGKTAAVFQRAWEMMLARHLDAQGYRLTTADKGPDFRFEHDGLTVWVEAVSPEPEGVPDHWLEKPKPNEFKVGDVPHLEVLLRWTAAIKAKWNKLNAYIADGIVRANDAYVIAVNGCQLGAFALQHGVSRFPYAVEAVYALGPVAIPVDRETGKFGKPFVSRREEIQTAKGAPVPTYLFIDPTYAGISAIMACSFDRSKEADLPLDIVHNHFARVHVPHGILGKAGEEWVTESVGNDEIELRRLPSASS